RGAATSQAEVINRPPANQPPGLFFMTWQIFFLSCRWEATEPRGPGQPHQPQPESHGGGGIKKAAKRLEGWPRMQADQDLLTLSICRAAMADFNVEIGQACDSPCFVLTAVWQHNHPPHPRYCATKEDVNRLRRHNRLWLQPVDRLHTLST